ncbi:MAG: type II secretion system F family protein [Thiobacillus sp.]|nr:type II secretion system F family protein [Thiobacillus sp.]MDP2978446.1 type II secretion system F family protein [Thiobacillus sp.]
MPLFQYKAADAQGSILEGEMEARAPDSVAEHLQAQGFMPIQIEEATAGSGGGWLGGFGRARVSQDEIAMMTREISTLLRAGLPLDRALEIVVNLSANDEVAEILGEVRQDVRGGSSLYAALDAQQGVFSRFYLNMIRAGEAGGALEVVMLRLTEFMERAKDLRETVKSALIYPAILVMVAVVSVVVLLIFVVPQFTQMFEESGKALPLATQIVVGAGEFFQAWWWALIGGSLVLSALFKRQMADPDSRYRWDERFLALPLIGDLVAKIEMARFSRTLGTLLDNGVSLLSALSIVKETLTNSVMADRLDEVATKLREGKGLGVPLMEAEVFPRLGVHMVMVGEETGRLSEMLIQVADVFDREVKTAVKRTLGLLEPALILGLGLLIGAIIMSILVAILSVNELAV